MNQFSICLLTGLALALPATAAVDISKLPPASKQAGVTYAKDIRPIFEASCFRCHGADRQKADLRLDSLEAVLKGGEHENTVVPGKSAESKLVIAVARLDPKKAMPPQPRGPGGPGGQGRPAASGTSTNAAPATAAAPQGGGQRPGGGRGQGPAPKPLTTEQVGLIRAWIDQGAK